MSRRLELQTILENILGSDHVYFQPPKNVEMDYPCIKYSLAFLKTEFANDNPYNHRVQYIVTVIDKDPDSIIPLKLAMLPTCMFDRHYVADNLNHDVFNIYY